jgi:uncharacterized protein (DUF1501 family)
MKGRAMHDPTRRELLRRAAALSLAGGAAAPFALNLATLGSAAAQTAGGGYRALVCVFLYGGNDAYNTVLATDADSWRNYTAIRAQSPESIALVAAGVPGDPASPGGSPARLGGVLALPGGTLQNPGRSFALHPLLGRLSSLFASRRLAIVANVGPLLRPTTKADYRNNAVRKPTKLFSHNDQQSTWQALAPEGAAAGWGGRMADLLTSGNGSGAAFSSVSVSGNAVWAAGRDVLQYQLSTSGAIRIGGSGSTLFGSALAFDRMRGLMRSARSGHVLEQDHAAVVNRSIDAEQLLSSALPGANSAPYGTPGLSQDQADPLLQTTHPVTGARQTNPLAQQLQMVARTIVASKALGVHRQVLFASLGGFDTHDSQNQTQAQLMARLDHALGYFDATLASLGLADQVTTFTASDFGRTLTSNGDGTDHGWGAHHFVMGASVRGGELYGSYPQIGLSDGHDDFTSPDQIGNGSMLPAISVDQYAATMGRWLGLGDGQLLDLFPNLAAFDSTKHDLGFMS